MLNTVPIADHQSARWPSPNRLLVTLLLMRVPIRAAVRIVQDFHALRHRSREERN